MKINLTYIFTLAILFTFICSVKNIQAQNEVELKPLSERIDVVSKKLQLKLLLTSEQLTKINAILIESIPKSNTNENREETLKMINTKIDTVLTKKQKTKFDILKAKWLDELLGGSE